jgi:Bacterial regulatory helix-turn-helix protein, lysR family
MDFSDLRYLMTLADTGNFTRAAKSLGLNGSTVSRRISRLEHKLGLSLFECTHWGVHLTAGGKARSLVPAPALIKEPGSKVAPSAFVEDHHLAVRGSHGDP